MRRTLGILVLLASYPSATLAQESTRGFVRGFGGVTFMSETATVMGGGIGVHLTPNIDVLVDAGHMTNVLPHKLQRDLDDAARSIGAYFGGPLRIDGKAPAVYGFATLRVNGAAGAKLRLYAEGGGGVARGESDITAIAGTTNVSREVVSALGIKKSETAGVMVLGGGMTVPLTGRLAVDVGYRFMRIFTDDPRINTANMSAGLHWSF